MKINISVTFETIMTWQFKSISIIIGVLPTKLEPVARNPYLVPVSNNGKITKSFDLMSECITKYKLWTSSRKLLDLTVNICMLYTFKYSY